MTLNTVTIWQMRWRSKIGADDTIHKVEPPPIPFPHSRLSIYTIGMSKGQSLKMVICLESSLDPPGPRVQPGAEMTRRNCCIQTSSIQHYI